MIDTILSNIKVAVGFYQVTNSLMETFSYTKWPDSLQVISKYSEILQLNIFQVASVHCLSTGLQADAFENLFAIMAINAAIVGFAGIAYGVCKLSILRNRSLEGEEKLRKVSLAKEFVYRKLFFVLLHTSARALRWPLSYHLLAENFAETKKKRCAASTSKQITVYCVIIQHTANWLS